MSPVSSCAAFAITSGLTVDLAPGLNFLVGPVGSGKTSVVEALHVGCTGRSFRTSNEREMVRFGDGAARVELTCRGEGGAHRIEVVLQTGAPKLIKRDGAKLSVLRADPSTPRVCVFAPDHLELVKGAAGIRRAHLDELVAALWPARRATRLAYAKALAQRNSLLGRVRSGACRLPTALGAWDRELARHGIELMRHRARRGRAAGRSLHGAGAGPRPADTGDGHLPPALEGLRCGRAGGGVARTAAVRPGARVHHSRPASRRSRPAGRRQGPAQVWIAGTAAPGAALAAAVRARRDGGCSRRAAGAAARRRDERARSRPPPVAARPRSCRRARR